VVTALALTASASVLAAAAYERRGVFADGAAQPTSGPQLPLDAPLPAQVPPGTILTIGDPITQHVLEHTGWDRNLPFQIRWAAISGGPEVTEAFHAKALDVGSAADIPPIHAIWVGMPVKIIAVRLRQDPLTHPSYVLGVAPGSGIRALADLRGKRIAFSPGQVQGEVVLRSLAAAHLTTKDVTLVELPSTGADLYVNALVGGLVDVAPIAAGATANHYIENFGSRGAAVIPHAVVRDDLTLLYVRDETLEDPSKAGALRQYIQLWGRAQAWIANHPDEWANLYYVKNQRLSPEDARAMQQAAGRPDVPSDWSGAVALEQGAIALMGKATGRPTFAASDLFDRRFEPVAALAFAAEATPAGLASAN
jgi:sulfonate transport system substrate-binding protein